MQRLTKFAKCWEILRKAPDSSRPCPGVAIGSLRRLRLVKLLRDLATQVCAGNREYDGSARLRSYSPFLWSSWAQLFLSISACNPLHRQGSGRLLALLLIPACKSVPPGHQTDASSPTAPTEGANSTSGCSR